MHHTIIPTLRKLTVLALVLLACVASIPEAAAAPCFGTPVVRHQPDGTAITLYLWGDEFGIIAETADGYSVVHDADGSWCYATRSADGASLVSTGLRVGAINPKAAGLADHQRPDERLARAQRQERQRAAGLRVDGSGWGHWARPVLGKAGVDAAGRPTPPSHQTTGTYVGLCLLVDFPDSAGTVSSAEVSAAMNQLGYTGMGNSGSVRDYFRTVSGGRLDYTNVLPGASTWATGYYRATHPRSYYDSPSDTEAVGAQALIQEALADLKTREPAIFYQLSYGNDGRAFALNVLYAGNRPDDWATGLWPHSWSLRTTFDAGNGHFISHYQISDLPSPLPLGTICHENGHMICDFPDLYNYESFDQITPVASWCLMGLGGYGGASGQAGFAPTGVCGYLRYKAGWATATELTAATRGSTQTALAIDGQPTGGNVFLIKKSATEYFLIENRNTTGVDTWLPGPGLAIYHVDERGDNAYRAYSITGQWECALVQADGSTSFLTDGGSWGDASAVFSAQGQRHFSYQTTPPAVWYNAQPTSQMVQNISAPGATMTFTADTGPGWIDTLTTTDSDDSSHCGSGGGFTFLGILLLCAIQAFVRRQHREP